MSTERDKKIDALIEQYDADQQRAEPENISPLYDPFRDPNVVPDTGGLEAVDGKYTIKGVEYDEEDIEFENGVPFVKREVREKYEPSFSEQVEETNQSVKERLSAPGQGLVDFGMDLVGMVPGLGKLDDAYDEATKFQDPVATNIRRLSTVIVPTLMGVGAATRGIDTVSKLNLALKGREFPRLLTGLAKIGATAAVDVGVTYISDTSEDGDTLTRQLDDFTNGTLNLPDALITLDSDGPEVRKKKTMYETGVLSIAADFLGYGLNLAKSLRGFKPSEFMDWFKVGDDISEAYKNAHIQLGPDLRAGEAPLEAHVRHQSSLRDWQIDEAAVRQLEAEAATVSRSADSTALQAVDGAPSPSQVDEALSPAITPKLVSPAENAVLSVPPASVARNALDVAAIKNGAATGDPAPVVTEATFRAVAGGNADARALVKDIADDYQSSGEWEGVVNGVRLTKQQRDGAASTALADFMETTTAEIKEAFYAKPSRLQLTDEVGFEYPNEDMAAAALRGIKELNDTYLSLNTAQSSARLLDTTGREIQTIADAAVKLPNNVSQTRVRMMLLDRSQLLMSEWALNKYVKGWSLQNTKRIYDAQQNPAQAGELIQEMLGELSDARLKAQEKALAFRTTLDQLIDDDPNMIGAFIDAFAMSSGDVTTIDKMLKWANSQISLKGMFVSPFDIKGKTRSMNILAQGFWAVRYNNILSGLSALRAGIGNSTTLMLKSTTALMGHGLRQ